MDEKFIVHSKQSLDDVLVHAERISRFQRRKLWELKSSDKVCSDEENADKNSDNNDNHDCSGVLSRRRSTSFCVEEQHRFSELLTQLEIGKNDVLTRAGELIRVKEEERSIESKKLYELWKSDVYDKIQGRIKTLSGNKDDSVALRGVGRKIKGQIYYFDRDIKDPIKEELERDSNERALLEGEESRTPCNGIENIGEWLRFSKEKKFAKKDFTANIETKQSEYRPSKKMIKQNHQVKRDTLFIRGELLPYNATYWKDPRE